MLKAIKHKTTSGLSTLDNYSLSMAEGVGFEPTCPAHHGTTRFRVGPVTSTSVPLPPANPKQSGRRLTPNHKEGLQQGLAFLCPHTADNLDLVIEARIRQDVVHTVNPAAPRIGRSIHQTRHTGM